jgi:hypothetical protein
MSGDIDVDIGTAALSKLVIALSLQIASKIWPNLAEPVFFKEKVSN